MNLKKNIIYNVLYQISTIIIPLVTAPYISRVIGKEGIGLYSYSTSIASYFALFILLGIGNYGVRTIAEVRDDKKLLSKSFCEMYALQLILSVIVGTIYIVSFFYVEAKYKVAMIIQLLYILSVVLDIGWFFAGTEQFKITVTRGIGVRFAEVALIFLLVHKRSDIYTYMIIMTGGALLGKVLLFPLLFKQVGFERITWKGIKTHIKPNLVLFVPVLAVSVFTLMDKIMLQLINQDIAAVGIYEYSEKIVKLPLGIISAIGTVMLPKISNLIRNKNDELCNTYFYLSMKYIGIFVIAMGFGIAAIAPTFSVVFYGEEFSECGPIITILSIILISSSWANIIRTQYLIPNRREKIYLWAVIAGAVVNLFLNFVFIPKLGAIGAAIGTIGAEISLSLIHTVGVWRELPLKSSLYKWLSYAALGIVMFLVVRWLGTILAVNILTVIIQVIVGIIIYLLCIFLYLYITHDEILLKYI